MAKIQVCLVSYKSPVWTQWIQKKDIWPKETAQLPGAAFTTQLSIEALGKDSIELHAKIFTQKQFHDSAYVHQILAFVGTFLHKK